MVSGLRTCLVLGKDCSLIYLRIDNSECQILGLSVAQTKELRNLLSYTTSAQNNFYSGGYSRRIYLIDAKSRFPTGLLYLVEGYLKEHKVQHTINDVRMLPKARGDLFTLSMAYEPYPEQKAAAEACKTFKRGIVCAPTGVGKSAIAVLIIHKLQVPTLVVVPSLELKTQLTKSMVFAFGQDKVGKGKPIYVENVDALDYSEVQTGYDCVIIDEFHHSGAKTYQKLNKRSWSGIYYKIGLTATPFRSQDHEKLLLESVLSQIIYKIDYRTAVNKGYIVSMEAYYYELPKNKTEATTWAGVYSSLVVKNESRNNLIVHILDSLKSSGVSTICLVKEINHGETLKTLTNGYFAHGNNEDTPHLITLFNRGQLTTLIGTTGVIGEGIDTKPAEFVIIAGLGKSKNAFMQQVGRGFRKFDNKVSCKIIMFLDRSHKWTISHFKAQCKVLAEEYGVTPVKLEFP